MMYLAIIVALCLFGGVNSEGKECSRVADIVFVLDASESIYDQDFITQMDFVINITNQFYLNQTHGIVVGAVVYSSDIGDVVSLNDSKTQSEFETAVRNFVHLKDGTDTGLGIRRMRQLFADGGRPGVSKMGIVITDGRSVDKEQTLLQSHYARLRNITMLAVGVGIEIDFQELQGIASGSNFLFRVQNYETLGSLALNLTTSLCPETSEAEPIQEGCEGVADVFFVIDGSESIFDEDFLVQLDFVKDVTNDLVLNETDGYVVGALVFSSVVNSEIHLRPVLSQTGFRRSLDQATRIKAGTATHTGLRRTREIIQLEGRFGVRQVAIVITDGRSKNNTATVIEANLLKESGVDVIAIGIGYLIDQTELYSIASNPEFVFILDNFQDMRNFTGNVSALLCPQQDDPATSTDIPSTTTDIPSTTTDIPSTTTSTPTTTPRRRENDTDECSGCRIVNGVGYNPHPSRCDMYTQCYPVGEGHFRSVFRPCPPGLFWQQSALTCNRPAEVDCPYDLCIGSTQNSVAHPDSCRAYWMCSGGDTVGAGCCGRFQSFLPGIGCAQDFGCADDCILDHVIQASTACHYEEHETNSQKYYLYEWGLRREMPCAPGTAFSFQSCSCIVVSDTGAARECRPDLYLPFDDFVDHARGNWVDQRGVVIRNVGGAVGGLAAYFDGSSSVVIPRFANYDFQQNVYITLRYLPDGPSQTGRPEALVTNADCDHNPSIAVYHDNQVQSSGGIVRTPGEYNSTTRYSINDWIEVTYSYDGEYLLLTTNADSHGTVAQGNIAVVQSALHIGDGAGFANFRGYIDELYVYLTCRP
ncbi:protein PIF-like [Liolophura sinensis]|uniref:protein PIF-like n=1 Tax=Liolophura sinensis TaxID=3198878 RepID=UPI00315958D4